MRSWLSGRGHQTSPDAAHISDFGVEGPGFHNALDQTNHAIPKRLRGWGMTRLFYRFCECHRGVWIEVEHIFLGRREAASTSRERLDLLYADRARQFTCL